MGAVLTRRILRLVPQLLVLVTIAFALVHLTPGSTGTINVDTGSTQNLEQLREQLGLNRPLHIQYFDWLVSVARLDFGMSYVDGRPVIDKILERLPATLLLTGTALVVATILGFLLGIIAAVRQNTWVDYGATLFAFFGLSIPSFWAGLLMIILFSVTLRLLPAQAMTSIGGGGALDVARHLILPATVLALDATLPVRAFLHGRHARGGLHPHRPGQGAP